MGHPSKTHARKAPWVVTFLLGCWFLASTPLPGIVCDCSQPPEPEEAFLHADAVFHGTVIGVEDLPEEDLYLFEVATVWKGFPSSPLEVLSFASCTCCAPCLREGEEYLIYSAYTAGGLHVNHAPFYSPFGGRGVPYTPSEAGLLGSPIWSSDGLPAFRRGDPNGDGRVDVSDAVAILGGLFVAYWQPACERGADLNDSGVIDITDPIYLLQYLFLGGPPPAVPFPACGADPTLDYLSCEEPACGLAGF